MTGEDKLAAFLGEASGPAADLAFTATILQRVARRELARQLLTAAGLASLAMVALWASAPALLAIIESVSTALAPAAAVLVIVASLLLFGRDLLAPTTGH